MNTSRYRNSKWVVLLLMAISFGYASQAQSLRGKVIYISSQPVKFKFGSRITDYGFTDRTQASTLRVEVSGKKNLSINNTGNFKTVNLVVTEGANTHLFILYYVGQGNPAAGEEVYDFSTPELLKAEILEITKGRNSSPEVTDPQPQVTNIPMAVQDTAISKPVDTDQQQVVEDSSALVKDTVEIKKPVETVVDSAVKQEPVSFVNRPAVPRPENDSPVEAIAGDERANKPVVRKELPVTTASENTVVENSTPRPQSNLKTDAIAANGGASTPNKPMPNKPISIPVQNSTEKKPLEPKRDGTITIMSGPAAKQRTDSIIFMSGVDKKRLDKKPAIRISQPEQKDSIIFMSGVANTSGKLSTETSNASKIPTFQDHYNELIHLGDSTAWIAKNFEGSLRWYDSARKLSPYASYPLKQINAVRGAMKEQAEAAKVVRSEKFRAALADYKAADALRVERKFEDAYKGYSKFLSQVDSTKLTEYKSSELYYINQAKDYLARLRPYLPKPKPQAAPAPVQDKPKKKKRRTAGH